MLARIWEANGIDVTREYYINDAGNQIEKLGMSLLIRYKQLFGYNDQLPEDSYHGNEIIEAAHELKNQYDNKFLDTYYDQTGILDKQAGKIIKNFAKNYMLNIIKNTLLDFGVKMHIWFSESTLYENNLINTTLDSLKQYTNNSIPNSDLILIILEICLNSSQYGIEKDNSSRAFWDEVGKKEELKQLTTKFKTETLRKYWRTIRETKKFRKIISEIKKYKNELNHQNMKLFASIHTICEYVSNPGKKFDYYMNKHLTKTGTSKPKKITANDLTPNQQIDDIVNTFIKYFPNKNEKEIVEILFKNNFDIENTFLVLKDTENFLNLCFTEKEDEIIKRNNEDKDDKNEEYQN